MLELMQQRPLLISSLIDYAATWHGDRQIVSRDPEGRFHRSDYSQVAARAKRVAGALDALGVGHGDRVATLAWNSYRHLEAYYGITGSGRVLHTVNPRLFPEQLQYIMHHAEDGFRLLRSDLRAPGRAAGRQNFRWCAAGWRCATLARCRSSR